MLHLPLCLTWLLFPGLRAKGAFSHSAGTTPSITLFILGTPLKPPPYRSVYFFYDTTFLSHGGCAPYTKEGGRENSPQIFFSCMG